MGISLPHSLAGFLEGLPPRRRGAGRRLFVLGGLAAVLAVIGLLAAAHAQPQKSQEKAPVSQGVPNALQGFSQNRDEPMKIQADKLEVHDKDKVATFTGNVHVTQGDTDLRSRVLVVFYVDANAGKPGATPVAGAKATSLGAGDQQQVRRIEASGGVRVTQKDQIAVGDNGIFDVQSNTVTLTGNVVVTRGKDVVRGQRLVVDLTSGVSRIEPAAGGQVESLFQSAPRNDSSPPPGRPPHAN
jgi:lipopolysaccharide export system protein LptA